MESVDTVDTKILPIKKADPSPLSLTMNITPSTKSSDSGSQQGPCTRIRTIQRRGNTYMVRGSLTPNDDPEELDNADHMIGDLYDETLGLSTSANNSANCFKILYILETTFLIIAGAVIGVLTIQGFETDITKYIVTIIGFGITVVKTLTATFAIERRGVLLKDISLKLRRISRSLRVLQSNDSGVKDKLKKLEDYYAEVDELDVNIFDNNVSSTPATKADSGDLTYHRAASKPRDLARSRTRGEPKESIAVNVDSE